MEDIKIGWREWVQLPELGLKKIKAKIDTGARTSSLDSKVLEFYSESNVEKVRFEVSYGSEKHNRKKVCTARVLEHRIVTDSGGNSEDRPVIVTLLRLGDIEKEIEITLTRRKNMKFRMLLGRTALGDDFLIHPARSYVTGGKHRFSKIQKLK